MELSIMQTILSSQQPGFYEEHELSVHVSKKELLDIINKTDDKEGFRIRKNTIYTNRKLNSPKPLNDEEEIK